MSKFSLEQNLIHPSQIWFQSGNRTADHIFSLKTLIDKHIKQNKNDKIYVCFLDFKKAFDSVWDESLQFMVKFIILLKVFTQIQNAQLNKAKRELIISLTPKVYDRNVY